MVRISFCLSPLSPAALRAALIRFVRVEYDPATPDDAAALELVRVHDALVRRGLASHHGREVKHTGNEVATDAFAKCVSRGSRLSGADGGCRQGCRRQNAGALFH